MLPYVTLGGENGIELKGKVSEMWGGKRGEEKDKN